MAVPKRKTSKSKKGMRRNHQKTAAPNIATCPQCGEAKLQHTACPECGAYKDRSVMDSEE